MATKDIEDVLDDIETFLKANLNTKIGEVNTEKGDGITLLTIDSGAYFLQSMANTVANFNPFVFYGISETRSEGIGPGTAKFYFVDVIIVVTDSGNDPDIGRKVLRYNKALVELFENNYARVSGSDRLEVQSLEPVVFQLINSEDVYRAAGVRLEVVLA